VEVRWPSGIVQTLTNIPADQILHVLEPVNPDFMGQPAYTPGVDDGVYLWRDSGTGAYRVRISRPANGGQYRVKVQSSEPLLTAQGVNLAHGESYSRHPFGFILETAAATLDAGVDFELPAAARALIAVERDGVANPRQLHVGAQGQPLTPAGWIGPTASLGERSGCVAGSYGLSVGKGSTPGLIEARWRGKAGSHRVGVTLLTDGLVTRTAGMAPAAGDVHTPYANGVHAAVTVDGLNEGGVDVLGGKGAELGIAFTLDTLLPPRRAWIGGAIPPQPNAYWLQSGQ